MENVIDLVQVKFVDAFNAIQKELEELGYTNYNEVLNAKDFEIPQNRERVFMVSILKDEENEHYVYDFPIKRPLKIRLKDILEENVDEKYYLSKKALLGIINTTFQSGKLESRTAGADGIMPTLCARDYKDPKLVQVAQLDGYESSGRIYDENGLCPTINTMQGGGLEPKVAIKTWNDETKAYKTKANDMPRDRIYTDESIGFTITTNQSQMPFVAELRTDEGIRTFKDGLVGTLRTTESCGDKIVIEESIAIKEATIKGYAEANDGDGVYINRPHQKRGVVQKGMTPTLKTSGNDIGVVLLDHISQDETNNDYKVIEIDKKAYIQIENKWYRIRKLTPLECWRHMGISDEDFYKAKNAGVSDSQLYKQAGNGIVVNVFEAILRELIK